MAGHPAQQGLGGDVGSLKPPRIEDELEQRVLQIRNLAGAQTATLTNSPVAGNPTKWMPINDGGVIRSVPTW